MQVVGVILLLISVGTIAGPVGAVVYVYRNSLVELVVPPEISDIMEGNSSIFVEDVLSEDGAGLGDLGSVNIVAPVIVDKQIDAVSRVFTLTINFTNPIVIDLVLNTFSASAVCSQHNYPLGCVQLGEAVEIGSGQTAQLTISGSWTQDAENHFVNEHGGAQAIDASIIDIEIDVNGITIQQAGPLSIGSVPIG